jgi:SAM-dependent methyltransferase
MKFGGSLVNQTLKSMPGNRRLQSVIKSLVTLGANEEQWSRIVMNRETQEMINSLQPSTLEVLEISGKRWDEWVTFKDHKSVYYPEFDISEAALEETFDLIIAEQVFEHLLWPYRAGKNVHKMLNSGGHFLVTTPFLIRIHNHPVDCSRWTETGIKYFLAECGFDLERIRTGSWGNRACVRANFSRWWEYRRLFHSLRNEPEFPVVVWALAQK